MLTFIPVQLHQCHCKTNVVNFENFVNFINFELRIEDWGYMAVIVRAIYPQFK